jgi:hypothetical protein
MEILFENTFFSDKYMMREFFRKYSIGPRPVISIITCALMLLYSPVLIVGMMLRRDVWLLAVMYLVFMIVQFFPRIFARRSGNPASSSSPQREGS